MRIGFAVIFGLLGLAAAVGASTGAAPSSKTVQGPQTVSDLRAAPPNGVLQLPPRAGVSALTSDECTQLGGTVTPAYPGICRTEQMCTRVDNFGRVHSVCLSLK